MFGNGSDMTNSQSSPAAAEESKTQAIWAYHWPRFLLISAAAVCFAIFWGMGALLRIPPERGYQPMLLMQQGWMLSYFIIAITLGVCVVVGSFIAGSVRRDAGFFAACLGLMALSVRCGPAHFAYRQAESDGVFMALIFESVLWFVLLGGAWALQQWLHQRKFTVADADRDQMEETEHPLAIRLLATGTHIAAMCLVVLLLTKTDSKAQALAAVGLGGMLASMLSHSLFGVRLSVWMWAGALGTAVIGYLMASSPVGDAWRIGQINIPLARAIPLDYASAAPAGAVLGFWISRKWHAARQREQAEKKGKVITVG